MGGGKRVDYVDAAKGLAIICVVIGHVAGSYLDNGMLENARWLLNVIFNATYCFHMPFFFMISGFVFNKFYFDGGATPQYKRIKTHILNLVILYVFFSIIYGLFRMLLGRYTTGQTTAMDLLMIWARPIAEYWYLYVLIILYLVFLIPGFIMLGTNILFMVTLTLCLMSTCFGAIWELRTISYYMFFFCTGILLVRDASFLNDLKFTAFFVIVAVFLLILFKGNLEVFSNIIVIKVLIAFGISLGIWFLFKNLPFFGKSRFLVFFGRRCIEIYVLHGYFTAGNRTLLPLIGITGEYASIIANFLISLSVPIVIAGVMKKMGIYNYFFRPFYILQDSRLRKSKSF